MSLKQSPAESIRVLIGRGAKLRPEAPAFLGTGGPALSYGQLDELMTAAAGALAGLGVTAEERVALVTANGPVAATSFLAFGACCGCAPLNPAYREEEFRYYLEDLKPSLVVIERGTGAPARRAAEALGIRVRVLRPEPERGAGWFRLEGEAGRGEARFAGAGAVALYLHTSGTTSRPKLVPLTQRNLLRSARNVAETLGLRAGDRCLSVMPLFHIHGLVAAVLASLEAGASVACAPGFDVTRFFDWLEEFGPTWYTAVPTMHHAIAERAALCAEQAGKARLRFARSSSAPLAPQVMARIEEIFRAPLVEAYGMTEAAHQMASNPLPPLERKPGSVGLPAGPEVAIMDGTGRLLEGGERGEIVIRGENVMAGYAAKEAANLAAFTEGWFRTGDEGYFDSDGYLFLTGRLKEMINRGGEKIAPREVDEVLMDHPAVEQALAFGVPDDKLGEEVAAAVVLRPGMSATEDELQDFAVARLADFKAPRRIVFLPAIPKGPTGKLQRIGMAERLGISTVARAPVEVGGASSRLTGLLVEIWKQVLRRGDVGAESHFFELGGDSMLAAQAVARVNELTGGSCTVMHLFRAPTPAALAGVAGQAAAAPAEPPEAKPAGPSRPSPAQERMLFLYDYEEEPRLFNRPAYLRLRGRIEPESLRAAFADVVARHKSLRTGFHRDSGDWQERVEAAVECPFEWRDLRAVDEAGAAADAEAARFVREPFDLGRPPLIQALLLQVADEEFRLVVSMHHLVSDGWSSRVVFRDLFAFYDARLGRAHVDLPPIVAGAAEFARWQEAAEAGPESERHIEFWRRRLEDAPSVSGVPLDFARPARQSYASADLSLSLDAGLSGALHGLGASRGASLFMVLMAAFQALLARASGAVDMVVGFLAAGRSRPEFEPLCGYFCRLLPLRGNLADNPAFETLLDQTREAVLEALAHQDLPFDTLLERLHVPRATSHGRLVQVQFQLRNLPVESEAPAGCAVEALECSTGLSPMDLHMEVSETGAGLNCRLTYLTGLYRPETARELLDAYGCILRSIAASPQTRLGELPLMTAEREAEVACLRGESRPIGEPVLYEILRSAAGCPEKTAFVCGGRGITFAAYLDAARRTAAQLREAGIEPGARVALMLRRSEMSPAHLLGIWLAGCVIVPLDPAWPAHRVAFVLEDCEAEALLTERGCAGLAPGAARRVLLVEDGACASAAASLPALTAQSPACVLYTSGSTGRPKGAEILHGGLRNVLDWLARVIPLAAGDVFASVVSCSFDVSYADMYLAPALGATVHIADDDEARDGVLLAGLLERSRATYMNATPSTYLMLLEGGWGGSPCLKAVSIGEALSPQLAAGLLPRTAALWNAYGPTETTDMSSGARVTQEGAQISLGEPVDNTEIFILDAWLRPVLAGLPGELCIGGAGLVPGYLKRPDLTAERFVELDLAGGRRRVYRTGDLVRRLPGGVLEFLGRMDHQVKVRGYRVELGEIEAAMRACPGVTAAVVVLQQNSPTGARLAAFFSVEPGLPVEPAGLRRALRERLPEHMLPSLIHELKNWPRTSSGKLDRRALESLAPAAAPERPAEPPLTLAEARVLGLFGEVLGRGDLGPDDDFFEAGGHSLLAVRFVSRLAARLNQRISLRELFVHSTSRAVAALLEARKDVLQ